MNNELILIRRTFRNLREFINLRKLLFSDFFVKATKRILEEIFMISKSRPLRDLASVILRIIKDERKERKEERTNSNYKVSQ